MRNENLEDRPAHLSRQPVHDHLFLSKHYKSYDRSKLPAGWLDCPAFGQEINCIVPSKVPLGEAYNDCIPPDKRYSFKQLLGRNLGLVIDLTNTTRYYSTTDLENEGIKHVKIYCKGRDAAPENTDVDTFVYEVMQFLLPQKHTKKYILVHCTHGHNRTGYMIVHYLMRSQPMSVTQAIKIFADARPPGIYKPDYIDALYSFYHERKPEMVVCPPTPEWKRSSEFDLNGEAVPDDDDDDGGSAKNLHDNHEMDVVMTNDDVLGDEIPNDQLGALRQFCYQMLELKIPGRGKLIFPGSHPVSLSRYTNEGPADKTHHFTLLDGEMIIDTLPDSQKQERRYLIYDMMAINQVSVTERPFHERWKMLEKQVIEPRNKERCHFSQSRNPYYRYDLEPFRVRRKGFWLLSTVTKLLKECIPKLSHDADGLIFQGTRMAFRTFCTTHPLEIMLFIVLFHFEQEITHDLMCQGCDDPYVPRTHEGLLKWKYPEMNSVDFRFEVDDDDRQLLYLNERGTKKLMEGHRVAFKVDNLRLANAVFLVNASNCMGALCLELNPIFTCSYDLDPSSYSGKIIECSWDSEEHVWVCMRVRTDKSTPNEFNTYEKVMRSIKDNITEDVLSNEIYEIIRLPMYADRIRIESKCISA
ncbi:hypothetical protein POTOM_051880 [Populus tomentosa]|uniref:mRNA guanylyltransferase n=1 Tax=Populus tomentosa TaxID=118781 RepID=A0A8X8C7C4_POPTO|nr:hypothetical protein POTOM_051880 [Populus tomentosa]